MVWRLISSTASIGAVCRCSRSIFRAEFPAKAVLCWDARSGQRATVTFFRRKPGHLLLPGRLHCGPVEVADIGIPADVFEDVRVATFHNEPALWRSALSRPRHRRATNMHAAMLRCFRAGIASTGAARLAARAALRSGAGLVTIASPSEALGGQCGEQSRRDGSHDRRTPISLARCSPIPASPPS